MARFDNELGSYLSEVHGKPVEVVPWLRTFIFKDQKTGMWSVTEWSTGLQIAVARTQKRAVVRSVEILEHFGEEVTKVIVNIRKSSYTNMRRV